MVEMLCPSSARGRAAKELNTSRYKRVHSANTNFWEVKCSDYVVFATQLFTATSARMASTTRCVPRTWRHSWRKTRSLWTPALCSWTTTAQATRTSAPPCTRGVRRHIAPSPSLNWHGWGMPVFLTLSPESFFVCLFELRCSTFLNAY